MTSADGFRLYTGEGSTVAQRGTELPLLDLPGSLDDPTGYLAEEGLRDAVNVALALGQPLLLTGEPGTGKTQLAASVAHELGVPAPAFASALAYYDSYRRATLPANLLQAQRDYFGAHTYERIDRPGSFHSDWKP